MSAEGDGVLGRVNGRMGRGDIDEGMGQAMKGDTGEGMRPWGSPRPGQGPGCRESESKER